LKEGDIVSIGAISSILGPVAALDSYSSIKTGTATDVSTTATHTQTTGVKAAPSSDSRPAADAGSGTGLSTIEAAVQTFMSDYKTVYGNGQPVDVPPESGMSDFNMAQLTSALRAMSRDFSQFFGSALGTDVQPFGLPLSSSQSLAEVQASTAAIRSSGSAGQTAVPVVQPVSDAGQAPLAATGIQHIAVSSYAAIAAVGSRTRGSGAGGSGAGGSGAGGSGPKGGGT
jgi:hypothetical protein